MQIQEAAFPSVARPNHPFYWAKRYADLGWRVIPVDSVTKIPHDPDTGRSMSKWQERATLDPLTLEAWFAVRRSSGVGIATGRPSGIVVIDIDTKPGKDGETGLRLLEDQLGTLPATLEAATPSGGRHLVFRYPTNFDGHLKSTAGFGRALIHRESFVDIRADGAQINVEPTERDGTAYRWQSDPWGVELAELPILWVEALIGGVTSRAPGKHSTNRLVGAAGLHPPDRRKF